MLQTKSPSVDGPQSVNFDAELISRYSGRGPRYTSYPTALQFSDAFTETHYREAALASNDQRRPLSLYVHIPFCASLCYYCGCNKIVTRNAARVRDYLDCLCNEISMQAALFDKSRVVSQLHFGGGTPTYLDDKQLCHLMTHLNQEFTLETAPSREFSIEVDPRSVHRDSMDLLAKLGFNRLSLGIQDFDPDVQRAVNRIQSTEDVQQLVDNARNYNYRSLSFDLIYGLPHQSVASFDKTLDQVIAMRPDRLAVYNYAHLPARFKGQRLIREKHLPSAETKLEILHHTIEKLVGAGYVYIGMDHFALPDDDLALARNDHTLQRNFQGYSTHGGSDLIALGVSAIGNIGNTFAQNAVSTIEYEALISNKRLPVKKGLTVDNDDLVRADAIQDIMCRDGIDFAAFGQRHKLDFHDYFGDELGRLKNLEDDGLISICANSITVSPKGRLLLRSIAMVFDRYLLPDSSTNRFSQAI
jgi:oxygen-independent coproporphyrinogen-3 oxidase